ncbi:MAG: class I adenylate-forming enzyme family protein [Pseudomonadota bacterium]
MNLADLVRLQAAQRPATTALRTADESLTYEQLWSAVCGAIDELHDKGVVAGTRVGVCLADTPAHVVYHYAIAGAGACLVPIDHRGTDKEVALLAAAFGVELLLVDRHRSAALGQLDARRVDRRGGTAALFECADAPWLISLSSGTTGRPKGALVTHRQMRERFVTQWVTLGLNSADRFALVTPLVFGAGRSFAMSTLAAGGELILAPPPLEPAALVRTLNDMRATATFMVPTLMRRLLALPGSERLLPTLRRLIISGEAFYPHEVEPFQRRLSAHLIGYYASSEGGGISVLQPYDFAAHGATVGQAAFGVDVEVVDPSGRPMAVGETGELRYRGPGVTTQGVDADGVLTATERDGWFYPGDLAAQDSAGYLSLRGRSNDVINRAGVNIYPREIEQALLSHGTVSEAAVVAYRAADGRDEIAAFVVAENPVAIDALNDYLAERLAPYKRPRHLECLSELPRAASGKTDKVALIQRAEAR